MNLTASAAAMPLQHATRQVWRILLTLLLLNLFSVGTAGVSLYRSLNDYEARVAISTRNLAQVLATGIQSEIDQTDLALSMAAREYVRQLTSGHIDAAELNRHADALAKKLDYLDAIRLTDAAGVLRWGSDVALDAHIDLSDRPHFLRLRDDATAGLIRSRPQVSRVNNKRVVVFAHRMQTAEGNFAGMVFAAFSLDHFTEKFAALDLGAHGSVSLLDESLDTINRYPALPEVGHAPPVSAVPEEFKRRVGEGKLQGTYVARYALDGIERISSFQRLTGHPLYVRVGLAVEDVLVPWYDEVVKTVVVLVIFLLISLFSGWVIYRGARQQAAANMQLRQMSEALRQSNHPLVLVDAQLCFFYVNPAFTRLFGYELTEVYRQPLARLQGDALTPVTPSAASASRACHDDYKLWFEGHVTLRTQDGRQLPVLANLTPVLDDHGQASGYVGSITDLTLIERHQAELEHSAQHDVLTGLPNRVLLRDRMQQSLAHAARREAMLAICSIDMDEFKPINDRYGHHVGDKLLVDIAQRLQGAVRVGDTVARLGGDEFVLLLLDFRTMAELEQILQRVQQGIAAPFSIDGFDIALSGSIGVAIFPLDENDSDILLRHADKAMYAAKQAGKNRYSFFDPAEEFRTQTEQEVRIRIMAALAAGEFCLYYQPKVDMRSGEVIGLEALIRWQHPELGLQMPATFLPFIEHHDSIIQLGNWVISQALQQMRVWQAAGLRLAVSVNVAARQFQQVEFVAHLRALLLDYPEIEPNRLELEILESAALDDIATVGRIMSECQELGVHFSLDDFGTGYSSLTYLRRLPAQVLKIDQSFVRDLLTDPEDLAITEGIVGLARAFQRTLIAEGVETVRHGTLLLHMGCDLAQGYGIARPMPAAEVPAWVRNFRAAPEWLEVARYPQSREYFPLLVMEVEHRRWVARIAHAVAQGNAVLLPEAVANHHVCNFGRWLMGDGYAQYRHLPAFKRIGAPHRNVHACGEQIANLLACGEVDQAQALVARLLALRDEVINALERLREAVALDEKR